MIKFKDVCNSLKYITWKRIILVGGHIFAYFTLLLLWFVWCVVVCLTEQSRVESFAYDKNTTTQYDIVNGIWDILEKNITGCSQK